MLLNKQVIRSHSLNSLEEFVSRLEMPVRSFEAKVIENTLLLKMPDQKYHELPSSFAAYTNNKDLVKEINRANDLNNNPAYCDKHGLITHFANIDSNTIVKKGSESYGHRGGSGKGYTRNTISEKTIYTLTKVLANEEAFKVEIGRTENPIIKINGKYFDTSQDYDTLIKEIKSYVKLASSKRVNEGDSDREALALKIKNNIQNDFILDSKTGHSNFFNKFSKGLVLDFQDLSKDNPSLYIPQTDQTSKVFNISKGDGYNKHLQYDDNSKRYFKVDGILKEGEHFSYFSNDDGKLFIKLNQAGLQELDRLGLEPEKHLNVTAAIVSNVRHTSDGESLGIDEKNPTKKIFTIKKEPSEKLDQVIAGSINKIVGEIGINVGIPERLLK